MFSGPRQNIDCLHRRTIPGSSAGPDAVATLLSLKPVLAYTKVDGALIGGPPAGQFRLNRWTTVNGNKQSRFFARLPSLFAVVRMGGLCRVARFAPALAALLVVCCIACRVPQVARSQFGQSRQFKLTGSVAVDSPDGAAQSHLERVKQYRAVGQWEEVVETLLHVMANYGDKVILLYRQQPISGYTSVRDYCHQQLASLPPEALSLYRRRIDAQARNWFDQGIATRDTEPLENIVQQMFCSSWADDALAALGEIALEQGDYGRARTYWERILPADPSPDATTVRVSYPDTDLDRASVHARLIWISILEGSIGRARAQLRRFVGEYPGSRGRLAGREVEYAVALSSLLESAEKWPPVETSRQWFTFAGNASRNQVMSRAFDVGPSAWDRPVVLDRPPGAPLPSNMGFRRRRVAETKDKLLSYHPLVIGDLVLVNDQNRILAFNIHTGKAAWGSSPVVYPGGSEPEPDFRRLRRHRSRGSLGTARFTMSVFGDRLYARMGNPVTSRASDPFIEQEPGYLVCLDISAQGRLVWKIPPEGKKWAFEGSPLSDGTNIYVAMRRSDVTPQAHVACFDAATGRRRWRRFVCAAQTPGRGQVDETTHNLLTLDHGIIYYNTNLGAVAALEARDGGVKWISLYRRAEGGDLTQPATHFYRDLNPCVIYQGKVLVAPADSESIFALEATTGRLLWSTPPNVDDAVHLLGVGGGKLWASGDRLWSIDVESGKFVGVWPDQPSLKGYGRGVLAGNKVLWPTQKHIHVFDQITGRKIKEIELRPLARPDRAGGGGGNLVVSDGYLLVATSDRLYGFAQFSRMKRQAEIEVTARPDDASAHFRLARCEEALKNWEVAARRYRLAIQLATPGDLVDGQLLSDLAIGHLYDLLIDLGRRSKAAGKWRAADELFTEAIDTAPSTSAQLSALLASADVLHSAGLLAEAVARYQTILSSPAIGSTKISVTPELTQPASTVAAQRIQQVIDRYGPDVYCDVESQARARIEQAQADGDTSHLEQLSRVFPHSRAVAGHLMRLAGEHCTRDDAATATRIYRGLLSSRFVPDRELSETRGRLLAGLAQSYEQQGMLPEARRTWLKLARCSPAGSPNVFDMPCDSADSTDLETGRLTVAEFVTRRLAESPYAGMSGELDSGDTRLPLVHRWERPLCGPVVIPRGTPREASLRGALVWKDEWHYLSGRDGKVRWTLPADVLLRWAEFHGDLLLAATTNEILGIEPTGGTILFRRGGTGQETPPKGRLSRFALCRHGLIVEQRHRHLAAFDTRTGENLWNFRPAEGDLTQHVCATGRYVAVQTREPSAVYILQADAGTVLHRIDSVNGTWIRPPLTFDAERIVTVDQSNRVTMLDLHLGRTLWSRRAENSQRGHQPDAIVGDDVLIAFFGGNGMLRLDPLFGMPLWKSAVQLDGPPLGQRRSMAASDDKMVYCATGSVLRAFDLLDGRERWVRHLGETESRWRLERSGEYLVAISVEAAEGRPLEILFTDPSDGRLVERMQFDVSPARAQVSLESGFVAGEDKLWHFN